MDSLNNFDAELFLQRDWQQKPLLIRGALRNTEQLISPEELAGLSLEEEMESRLVLFQQGQWSLRHGPFNEKDFQQLPASNWTLLVQAVDHASPSIAELMDYFRFIPNWRLDDIMVSYATEGGSVGPHFDNYDVFLVQASGQREWQIGDICDQQSPLLDHPDLSLLENFNCQQRYLLEAGDILYIPPGYSHWGIATSNDCVTCSVGFRAPAVTDILTGLADHLSLPDSARQRFIDLNPQLQDNPGEITHSVINQLQQLVKQSLADPRALEIWFGDYMTQPKYDNDYDQDSETEENILSQLQSGQTACRDPSSRFAYLSSAGQILLFINGQHRLLDTANRGLAELLCGNKKFSADELNTWASKPASRALILELFERGLLYFDQD